MIRKIITIIIIFAMAITTTHAAQNNKQLKYLYLHMDKNSQTNKVSYELNFNNQEAVDTLKFKMQTLFNGKKINKTCSKTIKQEENTIYKKITCEIPKLGNGEYTFIAELKNNQNEIITKLTNYEYIYENSIPKIVFKEIGDDKTQVTITIEEKFENIIIQSKIPKEVIENLNKKNKDELITASQEYKIIKADPLIAWSLDRTPANVTYTINKKVTIDDQKKFKVQIKENSFLTKGLKYIMFILILIIIGFIFKPIISKKNN